MLSIYHEYQYYSLKIYVCIGGFFLLASSSYLTLIIVFHQHQLLTVSVSAAQRVGNISINIL